jgi:hypothetical protein
MCTKCIIRKVFPFVLIASLFSINEGVKAQTIVQKELANVASLIAKQTDNTYRIIRLGSNKSPAILTVNQSIVLRTIPQEQRNDISSVRNFAANEAKYVAANALALPESANLKEIGTARTGNLWLSSYIVSYGSIPLRERFLRMNIGALSGSVMLVRNNIPAKQPNTLSATVPAEYILRSTQDLLGTHSEIKSFPKLVFIDETANTFLRLCYEVTASDPDMNEMWQLTFDATNGELIEKKSLLEHEDFNSGVDFSPSKRKTDGLKSVPLNHISLPMDIPLGSVSGKVLAKVHLHTPFDTLTTVGMPYAQLRVNGVNVECDSNGFWTLPSATYPLTINTSFNSKFLAVNRQDLIPNSTLTTTIQSGSADVLWDDSNSDPSERDAYYSVQYAHLADKRIDEKLVNLDAHMNVNVNINSTCNAFYNNSDTSVNFFNAGSGCSNTGQISDVVFHEYGHRVTNARYQQAAGTDWNIVDGSLGEGFADLNSSFIRDDSRIGICFFGNNTQILRNCDNTKKWPRDINPDIHISGEIISGAFWDLRKTIGHDEAEHLFHFMEYQMPDGINVTDTIPLEDAFSSTLIATIVTDDDDNNLTNGTPHLKEIFAAFKLHNISLASFIPMNLSKVKDQDTTAISYNTTLTATYNGIAGVIDEKSILLHYSIDGGKTYLTFPMHSTGNSQYQGAIPKAPAGTIVKYYASLTSPVDETDIMTSPTPDAPYSFIVGYQRILLDDAEKDRGWSLHSPSDQATTGLWVRDVPNGTFNDSTPPIHYIQQDTDHSPYPGTMCYITGNRIDPLGTSDQNFVGYDDVDNGATTLTTPAFDLSKLTSPVIRYWYYYSNDQGANSGIPQWQTDISNDNGVSWKSLQLTNISTNGASGFPQWTEFLFRVSDYVTPSSSVKIRFIASDYIGALVEAGVDDLEILDPIRTGSESVITNADHVALPYPNPIRRGEKLHFFPIANSPAVLTDLLGRVIVASNISDGSFVIPANIPPGIYFIGQSGQRFKIVISE